MDIADIADTFSRQGRNSIYSSVRSALENLETGFELMKRGDPSAEVYFDRAMKDFGCGGYTEKAGLL